MSATKTGGANPASPQTLIHGLARMELLEACKAMGQPAYRAGQLWAWLYGPR